jgi:hypothetical protein
MILGAALFMHAQTVTGTNPHPTELGFGRHGSEWPDPEPLGNSLRTQ